MASIGVIVVAFVASMFMAWSVGAESNSPPFAPAVGANALPVMRAALLVGLFASIGAVVQGANVSEAVGEELINGVSIGPLAAATALLSAAFLVFLGVRKGYPIPTAFTVTGAVIGAGLSKGGTPAVAKYQEIAALWLLIPFVGGGIAFFTAYLLRRDEVPETVGIPVLGGIVGFTLANISLSFIPSEDSEQGTLASFVSDLIATDLPVIVGSYDIAMVATSLVVALAVAVALRSSLQASIETGTKNFLIGLGIVVAFSSGGSQVGLATGPLQTLFETDLQISTFYLLIAGGAGILVGSWTGAPRLIQAVSREYSSLGLRRSIAALVPAFMIAQIAIAFGIPISFNEVIISSVIGSGLVEGSAGISKKKISYTVGAWIVSLFASTGISYGLFTSFTAAGIS